jgi:hypothetical protein
LVKVVKKLLVVEVSKLLVVIVNMEGIINSLQEDVIRSFLVILFMNELGGKRP